MSVGITTEWAWCSLTQVLRARASSRVLVTLVPIIWIAVSGTPFARRTWRAMTNSGVVRPNLCRRRQFGPGDQDGFGAAVGVEPGGGEGAVFEAATRISIASA